MPFQIHPNNYVWPAEDSLRRGMLAQASLQAEEIIRHELGETDKENPNEVKTESKVDHDDDDDDEMEDVRISNENTNDEQRSKPPAASEHDTSKRKENKINNQWILTWTCLILTTNTQIDQIVYWQV